MSETDQKKRASIGSVQTLGRQPSKSLTNVGGQPQKSLSRLKVRRPSYGYSGIPGIRPIERTSQLAVQFKRPPLLFFPTYQLDPHVKFHLEDAQVTVDEVLDEFWTGHRYNQTESPLLALNIAGEIMHRIKAMQFDRYRIMAVVTIGQRRSQSYNNAISFIWATDRDGYVDSHRNNNSSFIQATAFGIYLD